MLVEIKGRVISKHDLTVSRTIARIILYCFIQQLLNRRITVEKERLNLNTLTNASHGQLRKSIVVVLLLNALLSLTFSLEDTFLFW